MTVKNKLILLLFFAILNICYSDGIRVVTEEYPPYNYIDSKKEITGVSTEVVKEVLKETGSDAKIELLPWARAYQMSKDEKNVIIYSIVHTEERENQFKWIGVITHIKTVIIKLKSRKDIEIKNKEDLKKYRVGVVRGDYGQDYLLSNGIKNIDLVSTGELNLKKLLGGRVDIIFTEEDAVKNRMKILKLNYENLEIAYYIDDINGEVEMAFGTKTADEVVDKYRKALQKIKDDGRYDEIQKKWQIAK